MLVVLFDVVIKVYAGIARGQSFENLVVFSGAITKA
jgi:hypothetical protein